MSVKDFVGYKDFYIGPVDGEDIKTKKNSSVKFNVKDLEKRIAQLENKSNKNGLKDFLESCYAFFVVGSFSLSNLIVLVSVSLLMDWLCRGLNVGYFGFLVGIGIGCIILFGNLEFFKSGLE